MTNLIEWCMSWLITNTWRTFSWSVTLQISKFRHICNFMKIAWGTVNLIFIFLIFLFLFFIRSFPSLLFISGKSEKNNCFSKFSSNSLDFFGWKLLKLWQYFLYRRRREKIFSDLQNFSTRNSPSVFPY